MGTLAEPVSCPEGRSLQKAGCGLQRLKGGGAWKVPGFGKRRPWETLESLLTGKHSRMAKAAHHGPALPASGAAARLPSPPASGLRALLCQEGRPSKAIFTR